MGVGHRTQAQLGKVCRLPQVNSLRSTSHLPYVFCLLACLLGVWEDNTPGPWAYPTWRASACLSGPFRKLKFPVPLYEPVVPIPRKTPLLTPGPDRPRGHDTGLPGFPQADAQLVTLQDTYQDKHRKANSV